MKLRRITGTCIQYNGKYHYTVALPTGRPFYITFCDTFVKKYMSDDFNPSEVHLSTDGKRIILSDHMQISMTKARNRLRGKWRLFGLLFTGEGVAHWSKYKVSNFEVLTQHTVKLVFADNFEGTLTFGQRFIDSYNGVWPNFKQCMAEMAGMHIGDRGRTIYIGDTDAHGVDHIREWMEFFHSNHIIFPAHGETRVLEDDDEF